MRTVRKALPSNPKVIGPPAWTSGPGGINERFRSLYRAVEQPVPLALQSLHFFGQRRNRERRKFHIFCTGYFDANPVLVSQVADCLLQLKLS
jgi:hypothetical protein